MKHCFGCDPQNPAGLAIEFHRDGAGRLRARCRPNENHCGLGNVVHGGLIATIGEELAAAQAGAGSDGGLVVTRLEVDYERPAYAGDAIDASVTRVEHDGGRVIVSVELHSNDTRLAHLRSTFVLIDEERLRRIAGIGVTEAPVCLVAGRGGRVVDT